MNEVLNSNQGFVTRREAQLFDQINALEDEKLDLTNAYASLEDNCNLIIEKTSNEMEEIKQVLNNAVQSVTALELETADLNRELEIWKMNASTKLIQTMGANDFEVEIQRIQDATSFTILKALLLELKQANEKIKQYQNQDPDVKKENLRLNTKCNKLFGEWKYQKSQSEKLKTQNEFCLGELEHYQRKNDRLQNDLNKITGKSVDAEMPDVSLKYEQIVKDVCQVLKIDNENDLVKSAQAIEQAYQFLPSLQGTVEHVYATVTKNNIFNSELESYTDVTHCIENWAINLHDYKNLCEGLLDVLKIDEDQDRTVSFILENVRVLVRKDETRELENQPLNLDGRGMLNARDEENFMNACALMNSQNSDEFCYALKDLVDKSEFINEF